MRHKKVVIGYFFLALLCASLLSAQTGGAMFSAINGGAQVNGIAAGGPSTSIFPGDRIDVPASAAGAINLAGSSVVMGPNSSVKYGATNIEVLQGGARVSTMKGMTASVGNVLVTPKDASAKFDVIHRENRLVVVSHEGALTIKDGDRTVLVASGESTEVPLHGSGAQETSSKPTDFLSSNRLSEHPFYGVVNGVNNTPSMFPPCAAVQDCIRPSVSNIRPCCCPNSPPYCIGPPPQ